MADKYRLDLDVLKAIAIIAVVLYHMGIVSSGYLGVDLFFVINGFLIIPGVVRNVDQKASAGYYFNFLLKRFMRLLPLVVIATLVCMAVGFAGMLPDDYENLSESVIASNLFSNNILSAVTTKNYWDVVNDYKPLMHLWYIGILAEFYIVFPLLIILYKKITSLIKVNYAQTINGFLVALFVLSLVMYFLPVRESDKFYYLPYRIYELVAGGLIAIYLPRFDGAKWLKNGTATLVVSVLLLLVIFSGLFTIDIHNLGPKITAVGEPVSVENIIIKRVLLLVTVALSCLILLCDTSVGVLKRVYSNSFMATIGKMTFSIYVWHQIMLAFYRYYVSSEVTLLFFVGFVLCLALVSYLSYRFIEKKIVVSWKWFAVWALLALLVMGSAAYVYLNAGVVRDVPEIGVKKGAVHRNMHAEYCDRIYDYDVDFAKNDKINVLIEGVSFTRDWGNILLESEMADKINLSYIFEFTEDKMQRYKECDYLFAFCDKESVPDYVWKNLKPGAEVWGIGTKNFGENNGQIYAHRFKDDYFSQTIELRQCHKTLNEKWKKSWGENYVDLIQPVLTENGHVRIFTDDHKFISPDSRHLSEPGAKYYARVIDFSKIFKKK